MKCPLHNMAWHAHDTCTCMPIHATRHGTQETSLNARGSVDNQNLRGQEILRNMSFINQTQPSC